MTFPALLGTVDRAAGEVRLQRTLPATPSEVWDALTDPARLAAWLAPAEGSPGPDRTFVLRMNDQESATCVVTTWNPPYELRMTWDYTGEGPSDLRLRLAELNGQTRLTLEHTRIHVDPVQYGAGWHVFLDQLAAHLIGTDRTAEGCADGDFMTIYRTLEPRYAEAAIGRRQPTADSPGRAAWVQTR